jgi:hypothetical protein
MRVVRQTETFQSPFFFTTAHGLGEKGRAGPTEIALCVCVCGHIHIHIYTYIYIPDKS